MNPRDLLDYQRVKAREGGLVGMHFESPSIRDSLLQRRDILREELNRIEAALALFESEPRTIDALETIMKAFR